MYKGEADWTLVGKIKNNPRIHIPIFGNGDIDTPQKAVEYKERYGMDSHNDRQGQYRIPFNT